MAPGSAASGASAAVDAGTAVDAGHAGASDASLGSDAAGLEGSALAVADKRSCKDISDELVDLIRRNAGCEGSEDCRIAGFEGSCVAGWLCGVALNADAPLQSLGRTGSQLMSEFTSAGCECAVADCVDPSTLGAVCVSGQCTIESGPWGRGEGQ